MLVGGYDTLPPEQGLHAQGSIKIDPVLRPEVVRVLTGQEGRAGRPARAPDGVARVRPNVRRRPEALALRTVVTAFACEG